MHTVYKTILSCSQDVDHKKNQGRRLKKSLLIVITSECTTSLVAVNLLLPARISSHLMIALSLSVSVSSITTYDVAIPSEAADIICNNLLSSPPNSLVPRIQSLYPQVTAQKIHSAWSVMNGNRIQINSLPLKSCLKGMPPLLMSLQQWMKTESHRLAGE